MRKALIGLLIATTAASPLAAQDNGWHGRGDGERHQRAEGQQRPARQERQQAPQQAQPQQQVQQGQRQGGWQGRQQAQAQQQQVQVQQQAVQQQRAYRQGYQGQQAYRGGNGQQDAYRQQIEASRAANRQVSQGMPERYQRRAAENEANYERQLTQQRYGREGQRSGSSGYQGRQGYDGQNYQGGRSGARVQWNRTWRNDNRYDWQRYRYSNRDIFRSPYYAPRGYGYGYNRLSIGGLLDQIFWGQNYWIGDPYEYRLPPAPYGTQWVRYYNDVVLVDVYTGEVVDVIYDFFW
ncbi:MAG TPA: RcnB family protein [Allosphingosinicella sp.]